MKKNIFYSVLLFTAILSGCGPCNKDKQTGNTDNFQYNVDRFGDLKVLAFQVPGFDQLTLNQKKLVYYLSQAALSGRDIIWDQNYKHNLCIRRTLEAIVNSYKGDTASTDYQKFMLYTKRVWFSNGIHHHYSTDKHIPEFSKEYFHELVKNSDAGLLPLLQNETADQLTERITPVMFDPSIGAKRVNQAKGVDLIATSANNFYEGLTQAEVEQYYAHLLADKNDTNPVMHGLNSKLLKDNGEIMEKTWKVGGMYTQAIEKIVFWLEKAVAIAETEQQQKSLAKLIEFYKTGDLKTFDEYSIEWIKDTVASVDVVNGFIEVYGDPLGMRGSFEAMVSFKDMEASKRIAAIGKEAQWFEDHSPIMDQHKKKSVTGITAKVITVVTESGDAAPTTPIGVNLPNSEWIRSNYGSKSVNLGNIVHAYGSASQGDGQLEEFAFSSEEIERTKKYGGLSDNLHTDMHEVIGHASGQIEDSVGMPKETLKSYGSALEEGRADLVALYYLMDQKLVDMGVMPSLEVGKAAYDHYISNGLILQLKRIKLGDDIEEAHMRNRLMIAKWAYEHGKKDNVIEKVNKEGKTYFVVRDYNKLRELFGQLLREIQRIKSQGDYEAGKNLIEDYGVKIDQDLHKEILDRVNKLNVAPYSGFVYPTLEAVEKDGEIIDVTIKYNFNFKDQMLKYAKEYSFLPTYN